jgi:hypothetical protein
MIEAISTSNNTTRVNIAPVKPEAVAAQTENPRLWLFKYSFYLDDLEFSEAEAIKWANRSVQIDSDVRNKLKLCELKE